MKILGISCSPRKGGNTETLMVEALEGARSDGAEVELISVAGKDIRGCDGCQACLKTGECHIDDDVQEILKAMLEADGIIFGTPIYFYGMTAQAKAIMDRTYAIGMRGAQLSNKVGGVIAVAGGVGLMDAIKDWYFYIAINHMAPASYIGAYAGAQGAIKEKKREMKMAWELGRQMVQLVDSGWCFPEEFTRRGLGAYVAKKYGL